MKKNLILLTTSEVLFLIAESSIVIFGMIFFYTKFNSILLAASPFILLHLLHAFLLPIFSKTLFKIGLKKCLFVGSFFYILTALLIFSTNGKYTFEILILWGILYALGNVFHYVPIIYLLGTETKHNSRGKTFSKRRIAFIIATIFSPILGGLVSEQFGFQGLLIMCIMLHLLTIIPVTFLDKIEAKPPKPLLDTLITMRGKKIFLYDISAVFSSSLTDFWPIYVFIILSGSYSGLGILFGIISFVSIMLSYFIGRELDKRDHKKLFNIASYTNLFTWIFRALSFNYISVLLADVTYKLNAEFRGSITEVIGYDLLNDHVNDARASVIILTETIINYLIAFTFFAGALAITVFGFQVTFVIFALAGFIFTQLMGYFFASKT